MSQDLRIYVADLAAYNNGFLHGVWIDATLDMDDIQEQASEMLKGTPLDEAAEEYAEWHYWNYTMAIFDPKGNLHFFYVYLAVGIVASGVLFKVMYSFINVITNLK